MSAARMLAACIALGAAAASFSLFGVAQALPMAVLGVLAMLIVVTDLEQFLIPDSANLGILVSGIAFQVASAAPGELAADLFNAVLRGAFAALCLFGLRVLYRWRAGIPGIGLGDVKLAAAAGPWLGWGMLPVALELAALAALLVIGFAALRTRKRPDRHTALPFGAFLAPAIWLCAFAEHGLGWPGLVPY